MTDSTAAILKNNNDDDDDDDDDDGDVTWSPSRHPASWIGPQHSVEFVELNSHCYPSSWTLE